MTDLRHRIARAIHRYDAEHAFSVNDLPSEHHYGEADAVLAVLADHDRDAARQTTPHACDNCDGIDPAACLTNPDRAARQTTGQDDTEPAPWTTDGRHGPTPEEASAAIGQCGKWGGCILDASHTGLHRHTPRPADVEPYDHPGTAPAVGQPAEAHDTEQHRPPCTNGDHCGEPSHCPPSPAYERLQAIAAKANREMAGATLRAYKRVYQLAHNATGPIEPSDILDALKDPKPDPAKLLAAIMSDTVEDER